MEDPNTNRDGAATSSVKHDSEKHTIKNTVMKVSNGLHGDLKLEHKKTKKQVHGHLSNSHNLLIRIFKMN